MNNNDPWRILREVVPLIIVLMLSLATVLMVAMVLPVLLPVAIVIIVGGIAYLWFRSSMGRYRPPFD